MGLAERLLNVADGMSIKFLSERVDFQLSDLLEMGRSASTWLLEHEVPVCAMVLDNSVTSIACFFGAVSAGRTVVSIPLPPRASSPDWYASFAEDVCLSSHASVLVLAA